MACLVLLAVAVALFIDPSYASAPVTANEPTYAMLAAYKKQWAITLGRGQVDQELSTFTSYKCNSTAIKNTSSCLYPVNIFGYGHGIRVTFSLNNVTRGLQVGLPNGTHSASLTPTAVEVKMCYSSASYVDQAWRKKNRAYPRLDQNCHWLVQSTPWEEVVASNYVHSVLANFDELEAVPTASYWFMVRTTCSNGHVCQWDSTESVAGSGSNANVVGTEVVMGITPMMVGWAVVLSLLGPTFLISYGFADHFYYKKHGKPLTYTGR